MANFKIKVITHRDVLLNEVIFLGTKNSKTLGLFPEGAFIDHAKKQTVVVALADDDTFAGYVLFRISQRKRFVSVAHLCVHQSIKIQRHRGIKNIVPLHKIAEVMVKNSRKKNTFTSPVEVSAQTFFDIYSIAEND